MTTTTAPPTSPDADGGDDRSGSGGGPRRRTRSRWWRFGYPAALVLLVAAIPLLVVVGVRVILDSTEGQLVRRVTDPAAPGYEAVLEPTPTELVIGVDDEGRLDSVAVLALTADGVGGVLSIPAGTVVPLSTGGGLSLRWVHDNVGQQAMVDSLQGYLDLGFSGVQVVTPADWAGLVDPVAPLTVTSPDPVPAADGSIAFPQGAVDLAATDVWPYLAGRGTNESDLNRMIRQQAFWRAWLGEIGAAGPAAVPVPTEEGLGRFLVALSQDQIQFETLPVSVTTPDAEGNEQFVGDPDAIAAAIAVIIPFPEGTPGGRPRLRVLDGTGELGNGVDAAIVLAEAGAQIDVVGNARSFGQATTQFVVYEDLWAEEAEVLRDALGVGEVVKSDQTNSATDLTVVLGEDYLAVVGATSGAAAAPSTLGGDGG